jgi:hypothetical protein
MATTTAYQLYKKSKNISVPFLDLELYVVFRRKIHRSAGKYCNVVVAREGARPRPHPFTKELGALDESYPAKQAQRS